MMDVAARFGSRRSPELHPVQGGGVFFGCAQRLRRSLFTTCSSPPARKSAIRSLSRPTARGECKRARVLRPPTMSVTQRSSYPETPGHIQDARRDPNQNHCEEGLHRNTTFRSYLVTPRKPSYPCTIRRTVPPFPTCASHSVSDEPNQTRNPP